jgi:hypothetical protein
MAGPAERRKPVVEINGSAKPLKKRKASNSISSTAPLQVNGNNAKNVKGKKVGGKVGLPTEGFHQFAAMPQPSAPTTPQTVRKASGNSMASNTQASILEKNLAVEVIDIDMIDEGAESDDSFATAKAGVPRPADGGVVDDLGMLRAGGIFT